MDLDDEIDDLASTIVVSSPTDSGRPDQPLGPILAVIGLLAVLVVGAIWLTQETAEPAAEAADEPAAAVLEADELTSGTSFALVEEDRVKRLFDSLTESGGRDYAIAYLHDGELVVLDSDGATPATLEVAQGIPDFANIKMLSSGDQTWAIDINDRQRGYMVSAVYTVAEMDGRGTLAVIKRRQSEISVDILADSLPFTNIRLPASADVQAIDGRGLLIMPRTGGTFELAPLERAPRLISDDRAVAASRSTTIYESCDPELRCSAFAAHIDGTITDLPFDLTSTFTPSPDGQHVLVLEDETVGLFTLANGEFTPLESGPVEDVDWAQDSAFVTLLRGQTVVFHLPETNTSEVLDLPYWPDPRALVVFSEPAEG